MKQLDHDYDLLTNDEIREALAEVKQLRADLDELVVKREAVLAAHTEADELEGTLIEATVSARRIKEHLKDAL